MAPRLSDMIITYFTVGAVMWATGFIGWSPYGFLGFFIDASGESASGSGGIQSQLSGMGGPIGNIVNTLGGGLLAAWQFISNLIRFIFWPVDVLRAVSTPIEIQVLVGGVLAVAFVAAFFTAVRGAS